MGDLPDLHTFLPLLGDEILQQMLREHAAPGEVFMVRLQGIHGELKPQLSAFSWNRK